MVLQQVLNYYEIINKIVPGTSLDESMIEFILNKVAYISWSRTLLKTNIISGQHQEFYLYFKSTN